MILCCGEALIDMLPRTTREGEPAFAPHCGGATFNSSIALGRLGLPVGTLTGLSRDVFGAQIKAALEAADVDTRFLVESERPTTLAFVSLVDGNATYSFFDENSAGKMVEYHDLPAIDEEVTAILAGGISLIQTPAGEAYATLIEAEGSARTIMIDPNIRPGFIEDEAGYRARLDRVLRCADIIKVSDDDLAWLIPGGGTLEDKVQALLRPGVSLVVTTHGAEGATGHFPDGRKVHVALPTVEVVDTVGAGDTFNAGLLAELHRQGLLGKGRVADLTERALEVALTFGAKAAAVTVSRAGANPPWPEEIQ